MALVMNQSSAAATWCAPSCCCPSSCRPCSRRSRGCGSSTPRSASSTGCSSTRRGHRAGLLVAGQRHAGHGARSSSSTPGAACRSTASPCSPGSRRSRPISTRPRPSTAPAPPSASRTSPCRVIKPVLIIVTMFSVIFTFSDFQLDLRADPRRPRQRDPRLRDLRVRPRHVGRAARDGRGGGAGHAARARRS